MNICQLFIKGGLFTQNQTNTYCTL